MSGPSLRDREWRRFLEGPDPSLLDELYVPGLAAALRYDRCCAYFSSSVLAVAARGFGKLIERLEAMGQAAPRPAVRLVVNEEMSRADVRALTETGDLSRLEELLLARLRPVEDLLTNERLAMLGWLAEKGLLEVRVGVMRHGEGIVHGKFGIMTDAAGDAVAFNGSGNETAGGLRANYEELEISPSWEDAERHGYFRDKFDALWTDCHPTVHTVSLPEAVRQELIRYAAAESPTVEPSTARARQQAAMLWRFVTEAPYLPGGGRNCDATAMVGLWPHQARVVEETANAWPDGRLLCDEVGLGKTLEAIGILRRLLAGRGVRRALLLLPAGLRWQWQAELREKGGMLFPVFDGSSLVWPDGSSEKVSGLAAAVQQDVLLMSRETARTDYHQQTLLAAEPWDLVLLDEAHAARRKEQQEGEYNSATLLLGLLRELQLRRQARSILLLSATPMQTQPWEPWDLLAVLGEGGPWLAEFATVRGYYAAVAAVADGARVPAEFHRAVRLVTEDPDFPPPPGEEAKPADASALEKRLRFVPRSEREAMAKWMRHGAPLGRRMHRNTRDTLRRYFHRGLIDTEPTHRRVDDIEFDYADQAERDVYDAVRTYIERRFEELEQEKAGKGFVMTIYRRRAASSPYALEQSLVRRREGLQRVIASRAADLVLRAEDIPEDLDLDDLPEDEGTGKIPASLPEDPVVAQAELEEVDRLLGQLGELGGQDTKRDRFFDLLGQVTDDGRPALVFTEYTDTLGYLRDALVPKYTTSLGCYSGQGGSLWDGAEWRSVTKSEITEALRAGRLRVLVCTDAASEGLNLQAAGALFNYDLPWNPSKVEQRIGRIDRIGQGYDPVRVANLFLQDSIDDRVYQVLRSRCGLFEHFVGSMQPVLATARRMLLRRDGPDLVKLEDEADKVQGDRLSEAPYAEFAADPEVPPPGLTFEDLLAALGRLTGEFGATATVDEEAGAVRLAVPGHGPADYATTVAALERDDTLLPLSPFDQGLRRLADELWRSGECLPLVTGSCREDDFRVSEVLWVEGDETTVLRTFAELVQRVEAWDGTYPDPARWQQAQAEARAAARAEVNRLHDQAQQRQDRALARQVEAAKIRLQRELGRYLLCLGGTTKDLNGFWHQQMGRADILAARRLQACFTKFGDYLEWDQELCTELDAWFAELTENRRKARVAGSELDAALVDPRWRSETACAVRVS